MESSHPNAQAFSNTVNFFCSSFNSFPEAEPEADAAAKSLQSCPTLCDPVDGSPPGSAVPGILQARTLEWVAIAFSNAWKWKVKVKSFSRVWLFVTPWIAAHQAPPSMGFSRQEDWSGVPLPSLAEMLDTQRKTSVTFILFSNTFLLSSFACYARIMWLIFQLIDFIFIGSILLFSPPLNLILYFGKIPKGLLFTEKFLLEEYSTRSLSGYQLYSSYVPCIDLASIRISSVCWV